MCRRVRGFEQRLQVRKAVTREYVGDHAPNHFFDALLASMTSTTPGRRGSIVGAWLARIPMSPVAAARFTCTTSVEVKIAYSDEDKTL